MRSQYRGSEAMLKTIEKIDGDNRLAEALHRQDPITAQAVLRGIMQRQTAA